MIAALYVEKDGAYYGLPDPERDRPPLSTLPGPKPLIHEGQLSLD